MGAPGHTIDNCKEFKYKLQELIDSKAVTFIPKGSNIKTNPMPMHADPSVSAIKESSSQELLTLVKEIQTPTLIIREKLMKVGLIPTNHASCEDCISDPKNYESLNIVSSN